MRPGCFKDLVAAVTLFFYFLQSSVHQAFGGGSIAEEDFLVGIERSAAESIASLIFVWYISMLGEERSSFL